MCVCLQGMGEGPSSPLPTPAACCRLPWPNVRPPPRAAAARHLRTRLPTSQPPKGPTNQSTNQSINQPSQQSFFPSIHQQKEERIIQSNAQLPQLIMGNHTITLIPYIVHISICTCTRLYYFFIVLLHIYIYMYTRTIQLFPNSHHCRSSGVASNLASSPA